MYTGLYSSKSILRTSCQDAVPKKSSTQNIDFPSFQDADFLNPYEEHQQNNEMVSPSAYSDSDFKPLEEIPHPIRPSAEDVQKHHYYLKNLAFHEFAANHGYIDHEDIKDYVGEPPLDIPRISGRFKNKVKKRSNLPKISNNYLTSKTAGYLAVYPTGIKFRRRKSTTEVFIPDDIKKRGVISGFSEDSRRRLRNLMMRVNWDDYINQSKKAQKSRSFFVSLTYGQSYHEDWENYKRDLQVFRKRLARWFAKRSIDFGVIWKLEFQERGAAHYHLVLFTSSQISTSALLRFVSRSWVQIASDSFGYNSEYVKLMERVHLGQLRSTGKSVIPVYSHENGGASRLMSYLMKYLCKEYTVQSISTGETIGTGRVWGIWNKEHVPIDSPVVFSFLSRSGYEKFVDAVNSYGRSIASDYLNNLNGNFPVTVYGSGLDLLSSLFSSMDDPLSSLNQI